MNTRVSQVVTGQERRHRLNPSPSHRRDPAPARFFSTQMLDLALKTEPRSPTVCPALYQHGVICTARFGHQPLRCPTLRSDPVDAGAMGGTIFARPPTKIPNLFEKWTRRTLFKLRRPGPPTLTPRKPHLDSTTIPPLKRHWNCKNGACFGQIF